MEFTKDIEFNTSPTAKQELILTYHGFLKDSPELTIVYGFGEAWNDTTETSMTKTSSGFSVKINIKDFDTFNFCFRDSNNQWDNNCHCNYISSIFPCEEQASFQFDIDALIEEILQPLTIQTVEPVEASDFNQISSNPIDLGLEIKNILSQIETESVSEELIEYSTLDEILSCTIIDESPIELFEEEPIIDEFQEFEESTAPIQEVTATVQEETALVTIAENSFMISPRKLSKFYRFKKQIKLSFYKLFVKLPKLIFGSEEE